MGNPETHKSQSGQDKDSKISQDGPSDATSEKTLSDLEDSETISDSNSSDSDIPEPDGGPSPEPTGGRADGSDTGGPM